MFDNDLRKKMVGKVLTVIFNARNSKRRKKILLEAVLAFGYCRLRLCACVYVGLSVCQSLDCPCDNS